MKRIILFALLLSQWTFGQKEKSGSDNYFPPAGSWEIRSPETMGIDPIKLEDAIRFAISNETKMPKNLEMAQVYNFGKEPFSDGIGPFAERKSSSGLIIYKGYIVGSWGDVNFPEQVNSVSKSFLSTVVGLAVEKGLIKNIHDKVAPYIPMIEVFDPNPYRKAEEMGKPQLLTPFSSVHNKNITWDHLLRQTSDWEGTLWGKPDWADRPGEKFSDWVDRKRNEPGTTYKYNDTRVNALALAATVIWHRPLPEILREYVMEPIGCSNQWHWTGYRNSWIILDGKVIQSVSGGGHFGGGMFINALDIARFGLLTMHNGKWKNKQVIPEQWITLSKTPTPANKEYGFMNYFLNTDKKLYPSAPASAYAHIGNGVNMIYVDPENELVVVSRWTENNALDTLIQKVLSSINMSKSR